MTDDDVSEMEEREACVATPWRDCSCYRCENGPADDFDEDAGGPAARAMEQARTLK